jgi:hypothetical protein
MGIENAGRVGWCKRKLRDVLVNGESLSFTEKEALQKTINWCNDSTEVDLSLVEWMIVSRVVGSEIAIRFIYQGEYRYLVFDENRSRVVVVHPSESTKEIPVEEIDVKDVFDASSVELVHESQIVRNEYEHVTAIADEEHGTKLVLGKYNGEVEVQVNDGDVNTYTAKTTFSLPEPMAPDGVIDWVKNNTDSSVDEIVTINHSKNWDF